MYLIVEIITTISLIAMMHIFLNGMFEKKNKSMWLMLSAYAVYGIILTVLSIFPSLSMLRLLFNTVGMIILCEMLFKSKLLHAFFAAISMSATFVLTEMLFFALYSALGLDVDAMMSVSSTRVVYSISSQVISLLIIMIVIMLTKKKRSAITLPFILMLSPGYVISILLGCYFYKQVSVSGDINSLPYILMSVVLVYLNILIVFYAERVKEASEKQKEAELTEHHYAMQEQYYEQLRSEQNETRALFHDINKYLCAMRALASENHSVQASQVLEEAQTLFEDIGKVVDVGNPVISIIISQYAETAKANDISFNYDISVPSELHISASDAYILIGNTVENAIEACSDLEEGEKYINIKLRQVNDILFYQIENPFNAVLREKEKSKYHGYGLKSVKRCVEKYRGDMTIKEEKGMFSLSARMNVL